ncbi:MAG: DUF1583 domain-containing protein [Planctomycetaceae bacterium]|nr:DUF1583 domain-containing protein [Planctomycetaceae bacterium]
MSIPIAQPQFPMTTKRRRRDRPMQMILAAFFAIVCPLLAVPCHSQPTDPTPSQAGSEEVLKVLADLRESDIEEALTGLGTLIDGSNGFPSAIPMDHSVVGGALARALAQEDTDEQYDLLYEWTMPTEDRPEIRMLTTPVPQSAPPEVFAREIGERPRDTTFAVSEINGVRGLFCTAWTLALAAEDTGRLSRLTNELEELASKQVSGADRMLLFAKLADSRPDVDSLAPRLDEQAIRTREVVFGDGQVRWELDLSSIALAVAALKHEQLRPVSERLLTRMTDAAQSQGRRDLLPFLRVASAVAIQASRGVSGAEVLYSNRLKHWVPVTGASRTEPSAPNVSAMWLTHEEHVLHLAGSGDDGLFLKYPLTGDFEFTCETQEGGEIGTDGGLIYGGLHFEALGRTNELTVWDPDQNYQLKQHCPFVRHEDRPIFNRASVRATPETAQFLANLHPIWFDGPQYQASPWLGLRGLGTNRPMYRNFQIKGEPTIPREVALTGFSELRGWRFATTGESHPGFRSTREALAINVTDTDWTFTDGVIESLKQQASEDDPQSLFQYHRPLLNGETIRYEFFHNSDEFLVHPAIGRLAFLLESGGVRIHWVTDGELEWTGLPVDNATLEPLNRRGPRPLPLKENDWNQIQLTREDDKLTLSLNGETIYQRPIDWNGETLFGLSRNRRENSVRVRNVTLSGDWPEALPKNLLETVSD